MDVQSQVTTDCPQVYIVGTLVNANEGVAEAIGAVLEVETVGRTPPVLSPAMVKKSKGEKEEACAVMGRGRDISGVQASHYGSQDVLGSANRLQTETARIGHASRAIIQVRNIRSGHGSETEKRTYRSCASARRSL